MSGWTTSESKFKFVSDDDTSRVLLIWDTFTHKTYNIFVATEIMLWSLHFILQSVAISQAPILQLLSTSDAFFVPSSAYPSDICIHIYLSGIRVNSPRTECEIHIETLPCTSTRRLMRRGWNNSYNKTGHVGIAPTSRISCLGLLLSDPVWHSSWLILTSIWSSHDQGAAMVGI